MITVAILINGQPIFTRTAVRSVTPYDQFKRNTYNLDDGTKLLHNQKDGAIKLAIKMLKTIKEQK